MLRGLFSGVLLLFITNPLMASSFELVKKFEGFSNTPYKCSAGVPTIGYGCTDAVVVSKGFITKVEAEGLLKKKLSSIELSIRKIIGNSKLNRNQLNALISLYYNIGPTAFKNSTLVKKIKNGKIREAGKEILKWNKVSKVVSKGLTTRRLQEYRLYNK